MTLFYFLPLILLISGLVLPAFATVDDFTTDKAVYHEGDRLVITGSVSYDSKFPFVTVQIFNPGKTSFTDFNTVPVNTDGSFSVSFNVGGPTWPGPGIYTIKATYDGSLVKSIEYREPSEPDNTASPTTPPEPDNTASPTTPTKSDNTGGPATTTKPDNTANKPSVSNPPASTRPSSDFDTLKLQIPNFPAFDQPPQYYIDRYNDEPAYQSWFDSQFPNSSITNVVGYKITHVDNFPASDQPPQYYIDRYNDEQDYKSWFDSQFPNSSIYNVLGYPDPVSVPDWIRADAELWATGEITDAAFITGIKFMLENNIIMVSSSTFSGNVSDKEIPTWIRNNAHWWSQNLISEDEFTHSLEYLIQKGIITIN